MKLKIYFENRQNQEPITYSLKMLTRRAIEMTLAYEEIDADCEVSLSFCNNEQIRRINCEFRNIDRATDVLSFPMAESGDELLEVPMVGVVLGDIVLSLERAREQAAEYGHSFEREVAFLCVHSVLHLLGYDHEKGEVEDADMRRRQTTIVEAMGLSVK